MTGFDKLSLVCWAFVLGMIASAFLEMLDRVQWEGQYMTKLQVNRCAKADRLAVASPRFPFPFDKVE